MPQLTLFKNDKSDPYEDVEYHIQELKDLCEVFGLDCTDEMIEVLINNFNNRRCE